MLRGTARSLLLLRRALWSRLLHQNTPDPPSKGHQCLLALNDVSFNIMATSPEIAEPSRGFLQHTPMAGAESAVRTPEAVPEQGLAADNDSDDSKGGGELEVGWLWGHKV
jgi:hypothetical protein